MKKVAVIGLGFGDEGKGLVVDYLCGEYSTVPHRHVKRYCGGHQVGHMVHYNGARHVFSNFGSGTLRGVSTYWGPKCTFDPVGLMQEYHLLRSQGVQNPTMWIDPNCPVVTPYDKEANLKQLQEGTSNGTVGVGFGKTLEREENFYSLKVIDLFYPAVWKTKLEHIWKHYGSPFTYNRLDFDRSVEEFVSNARLEIKPSYGIFDVPFLVGQPVTDKLQYESVEILEGSQGLMLDQHYGFFPNVTRSDIVPKEAVDEYYLVTRGYLTRHGEGPMPGQFTDEDFVEVNPHEVNVGGGPQGDFRRGYLNIDLLKYAVDRLRMEQHGDAIFNLVVTCLDHMEKFIYMKNDKPVAYTDARRYARAIGVELGIGNVLMSFGDMAKDITY